jgi:hypothetical protein
MTAPHEDVAMGRSNRTMDSPCAVKKGKPTQTHEKLAKISSKLILILEKYVLLDAMIQIKFKRGEHCDLL